MGGVIAKQTNDLISEVLLGAFPLGSQKGGDSLASKNTADLAWASGTNLLQYSGLLLAETARVEEDRLVVPLKPSLACCDLAGQRQKGESHEGQEGLGEHDARAEKHFPEANESGGRLAWARNERVTPGRKCKRGAAQRHLKIWKE